MTSKMPTRFPSNTPISRPDPPARVWGRQEGFYGVIERQVVLNGQRQSTVEPS